MIRVPGLSPKLRKKKNKREAASPEPLRVLIGSTNGTRQDTESLARSQIERYFDTPDRSWFYIMKEPGVGHHFEIHQGGDGRPFLPSLLDLELEAEETLVIRPESRTAVEVMMRGDRTFQSLVLPESQSEGLVTDARLQQPNQKKMRPYANSGAEWVKVGVATICLGLLTITVAGILHKSFSMALNGYHEIVETLPASRLIELGGGSPQGLPNTDLRQLPVNQWYMIENMALQPGEKVDRLIYEHGVWDAHTAFAADYAADAIISDEGVVIGDSGDDERSADEEGRWSEDGSHNWEAESEWHDDTAYEAAQGSDWGSEHYPTAHELSAVGGA